MKHQFCNLREELNQVYTEYDAFAVYRLVYDEIDRLNQHYYDNFFTFTMNTPLKRIEGRTEFDLIESFWLRYDFSLLTKKAGHISPVEDGLPLPRALFGPNSNQPFSELSNKEDKLYKYNAKWNDGVQHMTIEFVEKNTCIRFARTYFMTNLSQHYMQGMRFYDSDEGGMTNEKGKVHEQSARILFNAYVSLIMTFYSTAELFLKGEIKTIQDFQGIAYSQFSKTFASRAGSDISLLLKNGREDFLANAHAYDSMGNEIPLFGTSIERKLIILRLQASHIHNPHD